VLLVRQGAIYHCTDRQTDTIEIPGTEILGRIFTRSLGALLKRPVFNIIKASAFYDFVQMYVHHVQMRVQTRRLAHGPFQLAVH
jgi:hypothetical protein